MWNGAHRDDRPKDAGGRLDDVYRAIALGRVGVSVDHTLQSLDPDSLENQMNLNLSMVFGRSDLSRPQREMIGVVASAANGCVYCVCHHIKALNLTKAPRRKPAA